MELIEMLLHFKYDFFSKKFTILFLIFKKIIKFFNNFNILILKNFSLRTHFDVRNQSAVLSSNGQN